MGWTAQQRADAVATLREHDVDVVHDRTGIPPSTLRRWARQAGIDLLARSQSKTAAATTAAKARWAEIRAQTANESGDVARRVLAVVSAALDAGELEVSDMGEALAAAKVVGILADKAQLLSGDATDRHEHGGLRDQVLEHAGQAAPHLRAV